jgi:hypothetical protein
MQNLIAVGVRERHEERIVLQEQVKEVVLSDDLLLILTRTVASNITK